MNEFMDLLSRGGLSLERLATLANVHSAGGLSKAAGGEVSRLSQYSRQVKDLESFFGVQLTQKVGRTIKLTEDGKRLAVLAHEQLRALETFAGEAGAVTPSLVVGAGNTLLAGYVLPRLGNAEALLSGYKVTLRSMRSRDLVRAVQDFQVDLALVRSTAVPRGLKKLPILKVTYGLYAPVALAGRKSVRDLLADVPLATAMGGSLREELEHKAEAAGVHLRVDLSCSSMALVAGAVRGGRYAGILPDLAAQVLDGSPVRRYELPFTTGRERRVHAVWQPRSTLSVLPRLAAALKDS